MWKMEGIISEAKQRHGLLRAKYRGLIKTQIQAYMVATVLNMKRLVAFFILSLTDKSYDHLIVRELNVV